MAQAKRSSTKRNANSDIEPHEPERMRSIPRLWIHPQWDQKLFTKGQVWVGIRMEGSTIVGDCFDCKTIAPPELGPAPCTTTINGSLSSFACRSGFRVLSVSPKTLEIAYDQIPALACSAKFYAATKVYEKVFQRNISSVDVCGEYGAAASLDKVVKVWNMQTEEIKCDLQDQGETNAVKWFPNAAHGGQPIIAYSAESSSIKLYNVNKKKLMRTLKGHTGRVQELMFADRGKHLLSSSTDGSVKFWDVSRSEPIETIAITFGSSINCFDLQTADASISDAFGSPSASSAPDPVRDGRLLLYGGEECNLRIVSLLNPKKCIFKYFLDEGVTCCAFLDHPYFACGTESGQLYYFDWRKPSQPLCHWRELRGAMFCMIGYRGGVICGAADGSCFYRNPVGHKNNESALEFCGGDYEPILKLCQSGGNLMSCGRDGKIRKYQLSDS